MQLHRGEEILQGVSVIATPGHTAHDISVVVRCGDDVVVIAGSAFRNQRESLSGDIFESREDLDNDELWIGNSHDKEAQRKSREEILAIADLIVPGHGPIFRNPRKIKQLICRDSLGYMDAIHSRLSKYARLHSWIA